MQNDKYVISTQTIQDPPKGILKSLKFLGPGFILSASIVGSGELIATTALGAKAGFAAFWVIIVSCLIKVTIQLEFGKHTIQTGETIMQSFRNLPGTKKSGGKWSVVLVFILTLLKNIQLGGILGGSALVLQMLFPSVPLELHVVFSAFIASVFIYKGWYSVVEKLSLFMTLAFTILTLTCLWYVRYTPYDFSFSEVIRGMRFDLHGQMLVIALGAFGITGVASDEILAYTYWCLEKGYAAYTGPRENTPEWINRAKGWTRVMYLDAIVAMIIYTSVTAAFYLLGASILHKQGLVPTDTAMVKTLANIYTSALGPNIEYVFLTGAFFVLFSSVFATVAYWSRLLTDIAGQFKWIDFYDPVQRSKSIKFITIVFPIVWIFTFLFLKMPVMMIISGGIVGAVLLILVALAGLHFRYRRQQLIPSSGLYDFSLWVSVILVMMVAVYSLVKVF